MRYDPRKFVRNMFHSILVWTLYLLIWLILFPQFTSAQKVITSSELSRPSDEQFVEKIIGTKEDILFAQVRYKNIYRSEDGGTTWKREQLPGNMYPITMSLHIGKDGKAYIFRKTVLLVTEILQFDPSTDTWIPIPYAPAFTGSIPFQIHQYFLYRSIKVPNVWNPLETIPYFIGFGYRLAFMIHYFPLWPPPPYKISINSHGEIYGNSWLRIIRYYPELNVWSYLKDSYRTQELIEQERIIFPKVLFDTEDNMYIGISGDSSYHVSADGGATWRRIPIPAKFFFWIYRDTANRLWIATSEGNFFSTDDGASWTQPMEATYRAIHGIKEDERGRIYFLTEKGLMRVSGPIDTLSISHLGFPEREIRSLVILDDSTLFTLATKVDSRFHETPGIYRSTDDGNSWEKIYLE